MNGDALSHDETWSRSSSVETRRPAGPARDRRRPNRWSDIGDRWLREGNLKALRSDPDEKKHDPNYGRFDRRFRDRRIVQWFIAYLAVAWLGLQLMQTLAEIWGFPVPVQRGISLALALGALPALVVAWYHGELGRQRMCACEVVILTALTVGSMLTIWVLCFA